jgi:lipid A disaccharide synthetase
MLSLGASLEHAAAAKSGTALVKSQTRTLEFALARAPLNLVENMRKDLPDFVPAKAKPNVPRSYFHIESPS